MDEFGEVVAVALVGKEADVEAELAALERSADAVKAARQPAEHRDERDKFVGGALA